MELAQITFTKLIEMFIILIAGIIGYKSKIITKDGNKILSNVLLMIVNPAVLFMAFQQDFTDRLVKGFLMSVLFAFICHIVGIVISYIVIGKKVKDYDIERIACIYSNCGFIGIPIINSLFGSEGVFYLAAYLTVFNILLWTQGLILTTGKTDKKTIISGLLSPAVISIILGILCCKIKIPKIVADPLNYISDMNTPLAMIVAGATMAQTNILKALKNYRVYIISLLKLLVIPVCASVILLLFKFDETVTYTSIIELACPTGASGTMFALRYNKNALYASELYIITTLLSAFSLPVVIMIANYINILIK
ncbi:MAG: AEC family transporter [Lachnospirales bacterium]